jgi:hypothetical protein
MATSRRKASKGRETGPTRTRTRPCSGSKSGVEAKQPQEVASIYSIGSHPATPAFVHDSIAPRQGSCQELSHAGFGLSHGRFGSILLKKSYPASGPIF